MKGIILLFCLLLTTVTQANAVDEWVQTSVIVRWTDPSNYQTIGVSGYRIWQNEVGHNRGQEIIGETEPGQMEFHHTFEYEGFYYVGVQAFRIIPTPDGNTFEIVSNITWSNDAVYAEDGTFGIVFAPTLAQPATITLIQEQ